jgi:uncharacterized membrane protein
VTGISDQPRRGRALHPPLTGFPIAAYVFAAAFDVISAIGGPHRSWAAQFWRAGTFVLFAGLTLCLLTMLTGFYDLVRFPDNRTRVTGVIAAHVAAMAGVFMLGVGDLAWRLAEYDSSASTPAGILLLTLTGAVAVCVGAACGGTLVFGYGMGVAAAGVAGAPVPERLAVRHTRSAAVSGSPAAAQATRHRQRRAKLGRGSHR